MNRIFRHCIVTVASLLSAAVLAAVEHDRSLTVFVSDIHVGGEGITGKWGPQPTYQNGLFAKTVDAILAMRPLPQRVVCLGDVAVWFGHSADYAASAPAFKHLRDAGIELHVTTGNHDRRAELAKWHPETAEKSPVPGRFVSVVDLGSCDLLVLDSLNEAADGSGDNPVDGTLDDAQWKWLEVECARRMRPFLCASHHEPSELWRTVDGKKRGVLAVVMSSPWFRGWINGHNHRWQKKTVMKGWDSRSAYRLVTLPSTGWWGDIGHAEMRTFPDRAELQLLQHDFFFHRPLKDGEPRPRQWDAIVRDNRGDICTFCY